MVKLIDMTHTLYIWIIDIKKKVAYIVAVIGKITYTRSCIDLFEKGCYNSSDLDLLCML